MLTSHSRVSGRDEGRGRNERRTNCVEQRESSAGVRDGLLGKKDGSVESGSTIHDAIGAANPLEEEDESVHRFELFDNFVIEPPDFFHFDSLDPQLAEKDAEDPWVCGKNSESAQVSGGNGAETELGMQERTRLTL